jgi:lactoylglutathione lyase/glyoxylase I family protein
MSIRAIAHLCLKTADLAATEAFYVGLLGFEKQFQFTRRGEVMGYYLRIADRVFLEAFSSPAPLSSTRNHSLSHFCLEADDLAGLRERLVEAGYEPTALKTGADSTLQFWVKDPNGIDLEVQQYTAQSAQFQGGDVEVDW